MKYTLALLSLALATFVAAEDMASMPGMEMGSSSSEMPMPMMMESETKMCKQMRKERKLIALAANSTKLEEVTKGNSTKSDAIKAKAATAQTMLTTMEANTTLVADCQIIDAMAEEDNECNKEFLLQKFVTFAQNDTAIAILAQNNQTKIDSLKAKAVKANDKLTELKANATLTADCPAMMMKEECGLMKGLMKFVAFTNNQTMLDMATMGDTAKAAALKQDGEVAQAQLDIMMMMAGAPTMEECKAMKMAGGSGAGMLTQAAEEGGSVTISTGKSAAVGLYPSVGYAALSTGFALALFMSML